MARITESELILPSLFLINKNKDKKLSTTNLINELRKLLNPDEEDLVILDWRKDDKFSQKVRNLRAHRTLEKDWYTSYLEWFFKITEYWKNFLEQNKNELDLIIQEEQFLNKISSTISTYYNEFKKSLERIQKLASIEKFTHNDLKDHFFNMLYSSIITSLETYLSDAIKYNISNDKKRLYLRKFVESFKEYEKEKFVFNDIFNQYDNIETKVEDNLISLLYHNLPNIKYIYKATFNIDFSDISDLMKSISIRHDLVHRNWKTKDWKTQNIKKEDIQDLCNKILDFVNNIEQQFKKLKKKAK